MPHKNKKASASSIPPFALASNRYPDDQSAALGMLGEVSRALGKGGVDCVIIGGWVPYLFNSSPIKHPGTFDVDVLLNDTTPKEMIKSALDDLMAAGYLRAAKNTYQIHRLLRIEDDWRIFHVDFIHRRYADDTDDLVKDWGGYSSIAAPGTDIIFMHNQRRRLDLSITLPNEQTETVGIDFCDEVGILATKGRSVGFGKRIRDGFDTFLAVRQSRDRAWLVQRCRVLLKNPIFRQSLIRLRTQLRHPNVHSDAVGVLASAMCSTHKDASSLIQTEMNEFFRDVGV